MRCVLHRLDLCARAHWRRAPLTWYAPLTSAFRLYKRDFVEQNHTICSKSVVRGQEALCRALSITCRALFNASMQDMYAGRFCLITSRGPSAACLLCERNCARPTRSSSILNVCYSLQRACVLKLTLHLYDAPINTTLVRNSPFSCFLHHWGT